MKQRIYAKYIDNGADICLVDDPQDADGIYAIWDCGKQSYMRRNLNKIQAAQLIQEGAMPYVYRAAENITHWPYEFHDDAQTDCGAGSWDADPDCQCDRCQHMMAEQDIDG